MIENHTIVINNMGLPVTFLEGDVTEDEVVKKYYFCINIKCL